MIKKDKNIFLFSKENIAELSVNPGETVVFETHDCFTGQIAEEGDTVTSIDFNRVNPATGPVYINGAVKDDTLKIKIDSIELNKSAVVVAGKGVGVLGEILEEALTSNILEIRGNKALFKGIELDINKMIGVIGVAPEGEGINCGTPGNHGGNLDCKIIKEGATVYLPIFQNGALFALGDIHALMGDGEIGVSGAEAGAVVKVQLDVVKRKINNPIVETSTHFYTLASALTLDEAYIVAVKDMFELLNEKSQIKGNDLAMLLSMTANLEICQVVDPLKTVRFGISKNILNKLGIESLISHKF